MWRVRDNAGWSDVTEEDQPYTLARAQGVGALQFTVAEIESGPTPDPSPGDLQKMLAKYADSQGLASPFDVVVESGPRRLVAGSFHWNDAFLRAWYISDGRNFAFVTYNCADGEQDGELPECERIVRSLEFVPDAN
jgi:hypothetical protein